MAAVYLEEHSWGGGNSRSRGQYLNKPGSQGDYLPLEDAHKSIFLAGWLVINAMDFDIYNDARN